MRKRRYIPITDQEGMRHLLCETAVICLSEADEARDTVILTLPSGRYIQIDGDLEEVAMRLGIV